jgi:hypothetical protein
MIRAYNWPRKQVILDLALLRKDLSAVRDVAITMPAHFAGREDCRMFALFFKKGQLYICHKQLRDAPLMGVVVIVNARCFHGGQSDGENLGPYWWSPYHHGEHISTLLSDYWGDIGGPKIRSIVK